jgi:hypothetical protein
VLARKVERLRAAYGRQRALVLAVLAVDLLSVGYVLGGLVRGDRGGMWWAITVAGAVAVPGVVGWYLDRISAAHQSAVRGVVVEHLTGRS